MRDPPRERRRRRARARRPGSPSRARRRPGAPGRPRRREPSRHRRPRRLGSRPTRLRRGRAGDQRGRGLADRDRRHRRRDSAASAAEVAVRGLGVLARARASRRARRCAARSRRAPASARNAAPAERRARVVRVVEDGDRRRPCAMSSMRHGACSRVGEARDHGVERHAERQRDGRTPCAALRTWCSPRIASDDRARSPTACRAGTSGAARSSSTTPVDAARRRRRSSCPTSRTRAAGPLVRGGMLCSSSALRTASPSARQRVEQLALHPGDARPAAEVLGVRQPDVRDDADGRARDLGRGRRCCPRTARPSRRRRPRVRGIGAEQRERQAGLVVERTRARVHPEGRPQRRRGEVLRRRLARRAGDADDRRRPRGAHAATWPSVGERGQRIGDPDDRRCRWRRRRRAPTTAIVAPR